jgi:hypothetical protein
MNKLILAVALGATLIGIATAQAEDRRIRIINETSLTMVKFQASNVGTDSWEEDILGRYMLGPGQSTVVNLDDGSGYCRFDLKATFRNGATVVKRALDVCHTSSWRVYE